jgi:uncharacterized protein with PIN domain
MKFIVDANVGKLAKWLRLMGYDARFFDGKDDSEMILIAFHEERVVLTRDTHVMEWGIVSSGRVKAVLVQADEPAVQIRQVLRQLKLDAEFKPFTVCLECNEPLRDIDKSAVRDRVPPYVFETQDRFVECPRCRRVYWKGTHWQAMLKKLEEINER